MQTDLEKTKTAYNVPTAPIVIIAVCLGLSFVDMLLLSSAIEALLDTDQTSASVLALILALVGSGLAFLWGYSQGLSVTRKKWTFFEPWFWLAIGLIFVVIRVIVIIMDIQQFPEDAMSTISSESLMAVLLSVLYLGTGLTLQHEARKLFDPDNYIEWRKLKRGKQIHNRVAKKYAEAQSMIISLDDFQKYFYSVKKQYVIQRNALYDAERATLSSAVKQLLEDNPRLDPQVVEDILQTVLQDRSHVTKELPSKAVDVPRKKPTNNEHMKRISVNRKKIQ